MGRSALLGQLAMLAVMSAATAATAAPPADPTSLALATQIAHEMQAPGLYPLDLAGRNVEGIVDLSFRIGDDGRPADVRIARGSGWSQLDRAALAVIARLHAIPRPAPDRRVTAVIQFRHDGMIHDPGIDDALAREVKDVRARLADHR